MDAEHIKQRIDTAIELLQKLRSEVDAGQPKLPPQAQELYDKGICLFCKVGFEDGEKAHRGVHEHEHRKMLRRIEKGEVTEVELIEMGAVSMEMDKYILVESYLMSYEEPVAIAVQRQFPFSIFSDIVLLTTHRFLVFNRFFTKIEMFDLDYIEFFDVTLKQGFFTSSLTIVGVDRSIKTVHKLVTEQALKVYRLCQDIETKARIARRQFELEENRSRTTTMQVNNVLGHPQNPQPQGGQTTFLSHREIANVGDEERDPYKSGQ